MRHNLLHRLQRIFALLSLLLFLAIGVLVGQATGALPDDLRALLAFERKGAIGPEVALISGHAGYDPGAICEGTAGEPLAVEAEINARVAALAEQRLRRRGLDVVVLEEYDERLDGLQAKVLVSLHADSCVDLSGYKAARRVASPIPAVEDALIECIERHYAAQTGLTAHPDTITHNMTAYHAFRRIHPNTPAAILEMGFLGGDRHLLTQQPERVAEGIAASVQCFLNREEGIGD